MTLWTANTPYACGWTMNDDCAPCRSKFPWDKAGREPTPEEAAIFQSCVDSAAELLYALSGRQFGLCELTVRPCRKECCDGCDGGGYPWTPGRTNTGEWINMRCNRCHGGCSCTEICEVRLPGPVNSIVEVRLDGDVLPNTAYRVDNKSHLVALKRPIPEEGALVLAYAFMDPSAQVCLNETPTAVPVGVSLGGNCYGPDASGRLQFRFEGLGVEGVTADYTGPAGAFTALTYPSQQVNFPGEAFLFAPFVWVPGDTITSTGIEDFGQEGNDDATASITLLSGTPPTFNAPRNQIIQGDFSARYQVVNPEPFCWPTCQNMTADCSEDGTWCVTYLRGRPVPEAGRRALAELACEFCLACFGDSCCALPKRVTSLTVEGATMPLLDPMTFIDKGLTGLYTVDLWLRSVNPKGLARRAGIASPDSLPPRRTTWQA